MSTAFLSDAPNVRLESAGALDGDVRARFEHAFGADLAGIGLVEFDGEFAGPAPAAAAIGDRIFVSSGLKRLPARARERILAHEIVHVLQKRNVATMSGAVGPAAAAALEFEADQGAEAALAGRLFRVALADRAEIPRFWGPAGHYYTSFFVMLAAGVEPRIARLRAFFCQMPDQVLNFDATAAAIDSKIDADSIVGRYGAKQAVSAPANPYHFFGESEEQKRKRILENAQVESGLHSLTGAGSAAEQQYRFGVLLKMFPHNDHLAVGLALHAFGDSFAHVQLSNPGLMYKNGIGHAAELFNDAAQDRVLTAFSQASGPSDLAHRLGGAKAQIVNHAHDPDDILLPDSAHKARYLTYILYLYAISRARAGVPLLTPQTTCVALGNLPVQYTEQDEEVNETSVIAAIRRLSTIAFGIPMNSYSPEKEAETYFPDFFNKHTTEFAQAGYEGDGSNSAAFRQANDRVRSLAARWARNFTVQSFSP